MVQTYAHGSVVPPAPLPHHGVTLAEPPVLQAHHTLQVRDVAKIDLRRGTEQGGI